ncbi:hypothetical protein EVAR_72122_1 [Eumeta japonica]|uniref:Uncharacterized protein n=1 Tax=Eumeta variegata TaxID=151549 RepID=A0A4C1SW98_EUMVA|nr:hypothetical protein EVAR_72122_1 [Eumeta japonica]
MLDYNPNKVKNNSATSSSSNDLNARNNGQFTKPHVPPLVPVSPLEGQRKVVQRSATASSIATANNTVPLNSSAALEDFEKKFKMNDEMRAVVQKVLSNPDLSTFIQTNASNTFVPFISPPISPANGGAMSSSVGGNSSVSIVPNPHVTITPQLPPHFNLGTAAHSPSSSSSHSSPSGGNRQKSVICSTNALLSSPSTSSPSSASHSPSNSRTRLTAYNNNHHNHNHTYSSQLQLSSSSTTTPTPMEVIDLSSPRRSLQAASAYLQQQQQQQQQQHQQQQQQAAAVSAAQQQS